MDDLLRVDESVPLDATMTVGELRVLLDERYWKEQGPHLWAGSGLCCWRSCMEGDAQGSACGNWGVFTADLAMQVCKWKGNGAHSVRPNPNPVSPELYLKRGPYFIQRFWVLTCFKYDIAV